LSVSSSSPPFFSPSGTSGFAAALLDSGAAAGGPAPGGPVIVVPVIVVPVSKY